MTGIEERLKALENERQIRALTDSFADSCLSGNVQSFEALWMEDGIWTLAEPLHIESRGRDSIAKLFLKLASGKRFFLSEASFRYSYDLRRYCNCALDFIRKCRQPRWIIISKHGNI